MLAILLAAVTLTRKIKGADCCARLPLDDKLQRVVIEPLTLIYFYNE